MVRVHTLWDLENGSVPNNYKDPSLLIANIRAALVILGYWDWTQIFITAVVANCDTLAKAIKEVLSTDKTVELVEIHGKKTDVVKGSQVVDREIRKRMKKLYEDRKELKDPPTEAVLLIACNGDYIDAVKKLKEVGYTILIMDGEHNTKDELLELGDYTCKLVDVLTPSGLEWKVGK